MAIYRCSIKTFSRANGESAVAAGAYRARAKLHDDSTGTTHDYSNHKGLVASFMVLPEGQKNPAWAKNTEQFWNQAGKAEIRKNSTVAREFLVSLPHELTAEQRQKVAQELTEKLVKRFHFGAMASIHEPTEGQDDRNHHVHILASTRKLEAEGFTAKTRELDEKKSGAVEEVRALVATTINDHLARAGLSVRVDHRSLEEQHSGAVKEGDIPKIIELDRKPLPHAFRGNKWEQQKAKQQEIKAKNQQTRTKLIKRYGNATIEDAQNRSQIIKQLNAQQSKTEDQISTAIGAYDLLSEMTRYQGASKPLQRALNDLDPLERAIFFDLHKHLSKVNGETLTKLKVGQTIALEEAQRLAGSSETTSINLDANRHLGQKETALLEWFVQEAKANGISFKTSNKPSAAAETEPASPTVGKLAQMVQSFTSKAGQAPLFVSQHEHQYIQQAKTRAANLPPAARAMISGNVLARLTNAIRTVQELAGHLRTCNPDQRAELLGRVRQAEQEEAAAFRALDEAKSQALAQAAMEADRSRRMSTEQDFIPTVMSRLHARRATLDEGPSPSGKAKGPK